MKNLYVTILWGMLLFFYGCGDSDSKRDDTRLDMSLLMEKYWFNNRWANDKDSYTKEDGLEVLRFARQGELRGMEFGGRIDTLAGTWETKGNDINLYFKNGKTEQWSILHSGENYMDAKVNGGNRSYTLEPSPISGLTADAFLVNEYQNGLYATYVGVVVQGDPVVNMKNGSSVILNEGVVSPLKYRGRYWGEASPIKAEDVGLSDGGRDIRFYIKMVSVEYKLNDHISVGNLEKRALSDFEFTAAKKGTETLKIEWMPYASSATGQESKVYYILEVYDENMDLSSPYFISQVLKPDNGKNLFEISRNTVSKVNKMDQLKEGKKYYARLSCVLFEPGIDIYNQYADINVQAITYLTTPFVWE